MTIPENHIAYPLGDTSIPLVAEMGYKIHYGLGFPTVFVHKDELRDFIKRLNKAVEELARAEGWLWWDTEEDSE